MDVASLRGFCFVSDSKGNDKMLFSAANNIQLVTIPLPFFYLFIGYSQVVLYILQYVLSFLFSLNFIIFFMTR